MTSISDYTHTGKDRYNVCRNVGARSIEINYEKWLYIFY